MFLNWQMMMLPRGLRLKILYMLLKLNNSDMMLWVFSGACIVFLSVVYFKSPNGVFCCFATSQIISLLNNLLWQPLYFHCHYLNLIPYHFVFRLWNSLLVILTTVISSHCPLSIFSCCSTSSGIWVKNAKSSTLPQHVASDSAFNKAEKWFICLPKFVKLFAYLYHNSPSSKGSSLL